MVSEISTILTYLSTSIPWEAVAASGVLSPVLLAIKKWFSVQSEKVMITLVLLAGMLTAAGHYLLNVPTNDPSIIAVQGAVLAFMTQPFYFFIVKPIANTVSEQIAKAQAFDRQIKSAIEPAPAVSGTRPITPVEDFSQ